MPNPLYPITLENATPETTPLGELAKLMDNFNATIIETAKSNGVELPVGETSISLVDIEEGSNRLVFMFNPIMIPVMEQVAKSVEEGDFTTIPQKAHTALHEISKQAEKQNWKVLIRESNPDSEVEKVVISSEQPITEPKPQFIKGTTTIFGTCIRVGGKTPKIDLALQNRDRILHCDAPREIVIRLSRSIYKEVSLYGNATWDAETKDLVAFKATSIANQVFESPVKALAEASEIIGAQWQDIDAVEFVNDLRSGGGRE